MFPKEVQSTIVFLMESTNRDTFFLLRGRRTFKMSKRKHESDDETASSDDDAPHVYSNKTIDPRTIPPKPIAKPVAPGAPFDFRMTFTNAALLRKFLEPVAHSVNKMRFTLMRSPEFTGFSMEAHASDFTLANKSKFECDIEGAETTFCVNTRAFMHALNASSLKDTTISITKYGSSLDAITFEAINNESDVRTTYTCNLLENSQVESLSFISLKLGFHVNIHLSLLKDLILNARKCQASTLLFELWQSSMSNEIIHSKMKIGFQGIETSGTHEFFLSAKKIQKDGLTAWEPQSTAIVNTMEMTKKCHSEYDNNKLRLFVNHMESQWVLVHLSNDNKPEPLVLEFIMGGKNTKHVVMIGPKVED